MGNAIPYMVMKITHSNEETKCMKHEPTYNHNKNSKITWDESGKGVHCKVSNSESCKMTHDGPIGPTTATASATSRGRTALSSRRSRATRTTSRATTARTAMPRSTTASTA